MIFNAEAATILKMYNKEQGKIMYSDEMIAKLQNNTATFKEMSEAEKVIENYVKRLKMPPSRLEIFATFASKAEFNDVLVNIIFPVFNEYVVLKEILINKRITTQDEIDAYLEIKKQAQEKLNVPGSIGTN